MENKKNLIENLVVFLNGVKYCFIVAFKVSSVCLISRIMIQLFLTILPYITIYSTKMIMNDISDKGFIISNVYYWLFVICASELSLKILFVIDDFIQNIFSEKISNFINLNLMKKITNVNISFFDSPKYLDILEAVMRDSGVINTFIWNLFGFFNSIGSLIIAFFMVNQKYRFLALGILLFSIPNMILENLYSRKLYKNKIKNLPLERQQQYMQSVCIDSCYAFDIRSYSLGSFIIGKYNKLWNKCFDERKKIRGRKAIYTSISQVLPEVIVAISLIIVINDIFKGISTIGDLTMYIAIFPSLISVMYGVISSVAVLYSDTLKLSTIKEVDKFGMEKKRSGKVILDNIDSIEFKNVYFRYEDYLPYVLKDLSFKISKNSVTCIIGINGAGKSTIIKLIGRYYDVTSGEILINSRNINDYSIESLRNVLSIVVQDTMNYAFTLRENIHTGNLNKGVPTDEDIEYILELVNANYMLTKMFNGGDTLIHRIFQSDAYVPSGGERQKIAIARSLFRDSNFLIWDEPTASLDTESEKKLFDKIITESHDKTILFTTHRLGLVHIADSIIVIKNGKVIEQGTHRDLIKNGGEYAKIYNFQANKYK